MHTEYISLVLGETRLHTHTHTHTGLAGLVFFVSCLLVAKRQPAAVVSLILSFAYVNVVSVVAAGVLLGWSEGTGLGSSRSGMVEPISGSGQVRRFVVSSDKLAKKTLLMRWRFPKRVLFFFLGTCLAS